MSDARLYALRCLLARLRGETPPARPAAPLAAPQPPAPAAPRDRRLEILRGLLDRLTGAPATHDG